MIWDRFGPIADPFDKWQRHDVWRFDSVKISQLAPIERHGQGGREFMMARWGLVPGWYKGSEADAKKFQGRTF
jgi:putative SOS response-associated peptidase YedK